MLRTLKDLFAALTPPSPAAGALATEHTLQLATAVMLIEVMRADTTFHPGEREAVLAALRDKFKFKTETDEEARRYLFPQNAFLKEQAS